MRSGSAGWRRGTSRPACCWCKEAQGVVSDLTGGPNMLDTGHILAANDALHPQLLKIFKSTKV